MRSHVVGSTQYNDVARQLREVCVNIRDTVRDPYRLPPRVLVHRWSSTVERLTRSGQVPRSLQALADAILLCSQSFLAAHRGQRKRRVAVSAAKVLEALVDARRDADRLALMRITVWNLHRMDVDMDDKPYRRAIESLPRGLPREPGDLVQTFLDAALKIDLAWADAITGRPPDLWTLKSIEQGILAHQPLPPSSFGRQVFFVLIQSTTLLAAAHPEAPGTWLLDRCEQLTKATRHLSDGLAVESMMLSELRLRAGYDTWRPVPAWAAAPPPVDIDAFTRTTDAVVAVRFLLSQTRRIAGQEVPTHRRSAASRIEGIVTSRDYLWRFDLPQRHLVIGAVSRFNVAVHRARFRYQSVRHDEPVELIAHDLVHAMLLRLDKHLEVKYLSFTTPITDGTVYRDRIAPSLVDAGLDNERLIPELPPLLASAWGRHERELLECFADQGDQLARHHVETILFSSLAALNYAIRHLPASDQVERQRAAVELLATQGLARRLNLRTDIARDVDLAASVLPWREPRHWEMAVSLGHHASLDWHFAPERSSELTAFWEAGLRATQNNRALPVSPRCDVLVQVTKSFLIRAGVEKSRRGTHAALQRADELIDEALMLYRGNASKVEPEVATKILLCAARVEFQGLERRRGAHRATSQGSSANIDALQTEALDLLVRASGAARTSMLVTIAEHRDRRTDPEPGPAVRDRFEQAALELIALPDVDLDLAAEQTDLLVTGYLGRGEPENVAEPLMRFLPRVDEIARLPDPTLTFRKIRGLVARGALVQCRLGEVESAIEILEVGTGRVLANLGPDGVAADSHLFVHPGSVVAQTGRPLLWLIAADDDGGVIYLGPDGRTAFAGHVDLRRDLVHLLEPAGLAAGAGGGHDHDDSRASGRTRGPSLTELDRALDALAAVLRDVMSELGIAPGQSLDIVPVGGMSRLPWNAAMIRAGLGTCVTHSTATSMAKASMVRFHRYRSTGVAVTAPDPSTLDGKSLRELEGARLEGDELARQWGVSHLTGTEATLSGAVAAFSGVHRFVHLALHGHVEPESWDSSYVIFANERPTETDGEIDARLSLSDMVDLGLTADVVFLAACWSAAPNQSIPDEGLSFQAATIRAGARCVIAPLWPIADSVTKELVTTFYRRWLTSGETAHDAFQHAVMESERQHPYSTTWAAFTIVGAAHSA